MPSKAAPIEAAFEYAGDGGVGRGRRTPGRAVAVAAGLALLGAAGAWSLLTVRPAQPDRVVEQFVAAVNRGAVGAALGRFSPSAAGVSWPVGLEGGPARRAAGLDEAADLLGYFGAVGGRLDLIGCSGPSSDGPDGTVSCAYRVGDTLSGLLGGGTGTGMIGFEVRSGRIAGINVAEAVWRVPPRWEAFAAWLGYRHPGDFERYVADEVAYASNGVPIHWVVAVERSAESGRVLVGLAEEFSAAGASPPPPELRAAGLAWVPALRGGGAGEWEVAAFPGGLASLGPAGLQVLGEDGEWVAPGASPPGTDRLRGVPAGLLAFGSSVADVWFSEDGTGWEQVLLADPVGLPWMVGDVAAGETGVLLASGGRAWHSTDGRVFTPVLAFPFSLGPWGCHGVGPPYALAASAAGFLAVPVGEGTSRTDIQVSPDGTAWSVVGEVAAFGSGALVCDVAGWRGGYVAAGTSIWLSEDGSRWSEVGPSGGPDLLTTVVAGEAGVLALGPGAGGGGWFSTDAATWRPLPAELAGPDGHTTSPRGAVGAGVVLAGDVHVASVREGPALWLGVVPGR